jgi:Icc-related predicted phosphoesterase
VDETGAVAWLHGGDVCNYHDARNERYEANPLDPDAAATVEWFSTRSVPVFLVRGNHDVDDPSGAFRRSTDATGLVLSVAPGLFIAGVGWSGDRHFDLPDEPDLAKVCDGIRRQVLRQVGLRDRLILLTHYPPKLRALFPFEGTGFGFWLDAVRQLIEDIKPAAVVAGHTHRDAGKVATYRYAGGHSRIVIPGTIGARLTIDTEQGTVTHEWLRELGSPVERRGAEFPLEEFNP